jgi:hypothetical protein
MIELARLGPYLRVGMAIALTAALVDCGLQWLMYTPLREWLPARIAGNGFLEDTRERVAFASQEYEEGLVDRDRYLCAIVGLSDVREGIDLNVLAPELGANCGCLGLAGAGATMGNIAQHADLLLASSLRPDLVVVGLGPAPLLDPKPGSGKHAVRMLEMLRRLDLRHAALAVRNGSWFYTRRLDVNLAVESALLMARSRLFDALKLRLKDPKGDALSPWRAMTREMGKEHYSEATMREELQMFESGGGFVLQRYTGSTEAAAILVQMINQFRERGAIVIVVIMPEHSWLRERMPENIAQAVRTLLKQAFHHETPEVIDLRDAIGDDDFVDIFHANTKGSIRVSRLLAAELVRHLPRRLPLMKTRS